MKWRCTPVEAQGEEPGRSGRGADLDRRSRPGVGDLALAEAEVGIVARIGAGDLEADRRARGHAYRARADDLRAVERLVEPGERTALAAGETYAAVALRVAAVGPRWTGIERLIAMRRDDGLRHAERTHHVPIVDAVGVDRADVLAVDPKWQADAIALFDVALAVGHLVEHRAACGCAQCVRLPLADLEESGGSRALRHPGWRDARGRGGATAFPP